MWREGYRKDGGVGRERERIRGKGKGQKIREAPFSENEQTIWPIQVSECVFWGGRWKLKSEFFSPYPTPSTVTAC